MKKIALLVVILGSHTLAANAQDSELDLAISSDMVDVDYHLVDQTRGSIWGAGLTYNQDTDATAVSALYNVTGEFLNVPDTTSGLGLKAVVHDTFQTAGSLALGGSIRFEPQHLPGVGVEGRAYWAPEILNTNDADRYHELMARVTYDVHPRGRVFAGWLDKTVSYDDSAVDEVEIANTLNLGFTLQF